MLDEGYVTTDDGVRLYFLVRGGGGRTVIAPNGLSVPDALAPVERGRRFIYYDVRNRGRSDAVDDPARLARGVEQDVDDLDAVRRHVGVDRACLVGHSYIGLMVALYAMRYPAQVDRLVMIGPSPPSASKAYPPELSGADGVLAETMAALGALQPTLAGLDPVERCRRFWSVLRAIYVVNPADAERVALGRCEEANERAFMRYWGAHVQPSIQRLALTADDFARVTMPALIVHGRRDRSAPYGGALDWAATLPNARLVTVDGAGHLPWIEDPGTVYGALDAFLA